MPNTEDFLTLYCDPGEDFGWALGHGLTLVLAGTSKMWDVPREFWQELETGSSDLTNTVRLREGVDPSVLNLPIGRVVCEDWRLYPDKMKALAWDQCRTARVIGALKFICSHWDIPFILQPAAIKAQAQAAGAREFYYTPLHENRHQNDAIQHFVFYTQTELLNLRTSSLDNLPGKPDQRDD
jgi:hypothetical protein